MKSKFAYLYVAFIISLVILVTFSFLFYKRLNSHLTYTNRINDSYTIILSLKDLESSMLQLQSASRAFLLMRDTQVVPYYRNARESVFTYLDSLKIVIEDNSDQMRRFLLMKSMVIHQVNMLDRCVDGDSIDRPELSSILLRSQSLMGSFTEEAHQIEKAEIKQRDALFRTKEFYEGVYPGYFNTIAIWAGIITLVSFYFINREVRMRVRYQRELEKRLQELDLSNSELSQFAFIASHDLQEPLRKIRTFSDKLVYKHRNDLDSETKRSIMRIEASAQRMQELLQDMLTFTGLISKEDEMSRVDLNVVINKVLEDFVEQSKQLHAVITWDKMPELKGNEMQLSLLFKSLIDNAFKFAKPGESPVIRISYRMVDGNEEGDERLKGKTCHRIILEDKGIGFDNEFAGKIFMIFQRLHTQHSGYRGKGIGLAIAQRIMTNHNGVIMARGMVNDGAAFIMYFPVA